MLGDNLLSTFEDRGFEISENAGEAGVDSDGDTGAGDEILIGAGAGGSDTGFALKSPPYELPEDEEGIGAVRSDSASMVISDPALSVRRHLHNSYRHQHM